MVKILAKIFDTSWKDNLKLKHSLLTFIMRILLLSIPITALNVLSQPIFLI